MTEIEWEKAEDLLSSAILLLRSKNEDNNESNKSNIREDKQMAELGAVITFSYRLFLLDDPSSSSSLNKMIKSQEIEYLENIRIQIGENDVVPGLELALRYAHIGDKFRVRVSHRFAYGPTGRVGIIKPDSNLEYDVIVQNIIFDTNTYSDLYNLIDAITLRKDCGNRWFSYNDFNKAGLSYTKGIKLAESGINEDNETNQDTIQSLYIACLNNLAACHLSTAQFSKAKEICIRVLEMDPNNIKALLRAARTALALHDYEECDLCLQTVLKLEPNNEQALNEMKKLKIAKHNYKVNANNMAMKMAKSIFTPPKTQIKVSDDKVSDDKVSKNKTKANINISLEGDTNNNTNIESINTESKNNSANDIDTDLAKVKAAKAVAPSNLILFLITSLLVVVISIVIAFIVSHK